MAELRGQSGIIPACAGSTALISINSPVSRDHPRMCGEHAWRFECFLTHGDHPRMCGEHQRGVRDPRTALGSSPHVRGARLERDENPSGSGIIPACAGSTDRVGAAGSLVGDHPRMCGEHITPNPFANAVLGSSPHVRGALIQGIVLHCPLGIIPACAGSTASAATASDPRRDHPRMCGEHLVDGDRNRLGRGSSPHVRGAHFENSIIPRKRKDNWLFFIQFRFENFLAFRYLLALLHPFLGVPTKDPSFASLGRLINCNPSQSTGDQSAPYTLKAICCSFLAE